MTRTAIDPTVSVRQDTMSSVPALRTTDLIGRDAELEQLTAQLGIRTSSDPSGAGADDPRTAPARAVLVGGDAGVGKTRLLMALRDAGWKIVNLACSLGREADRGRRRTELTEACRRARFELIVPDALPGIGLQDNRLSAERALASIAADTLQTTGADVVVSPSPHDGHHGHEVVARSVRAARSARAEEPPGCQSHELVSVAAPIFSATVICENSFRS